LKGASLLDVLDLQLLERSGNFGFFDTGELVRPKFIILPASDRCGDFTNRERFLRAEKKRFDNFRQCHKQIKRVILSEAKDLPLEVLGTQSSFASSITICEVPHFVRDDDAFTHRILVNADRALNRRRDAVCLFIDHLKLASLDEQPNFGLRP
jgi:hypothetical protein